MEKKYSYYLDSSALYTAITTHSKIKTISKDIY